jgi:hypothetical protein
MSRGQGWGDHRFQPVKGCPGVIVQAQAAQARVLADLDRNPPTGAAKVIHDALAREVR